MAFDSSLVASTSVGSIGYFHILDTSDDMKWTVFTPPVIPVNETTPTPRGLKDRGT